MEERHDMRVANKVYIYAPYSAEGGLSRDAYVLVRGEERVFAG
jgi:hypothetical protein